MAEPRNDRLVEEFLRLVSDLRKSKSLTHEELADRAGIHRTTVGLLERGERSPTLHVSQALASALGMSLSDLVKHAELIVQGSVNERDVVERVVKRKTNKRYVRNESKLVEYTGLDAQALIGAVDSCYHTLDIIDEQLVAQGSPPLGALVELANFSSMIGNLLGTGLAENSGGKYQKNRPHAYPDLLSQRPGAVDLELKIALETNKPKGHLAKAGTYITFRYVMCGESKAFVRGKENRGVTPWVWEVKSGRLTVDDFSISNTEGDSGKTATIKTHVFNAMPLVYFDPEIMPYGTKAGKNYPGFN